VRVKLKVKSKYQNSIEAVKPTPQKEPEENGYPCFVLNDDNDICFMRKETSSPLNIEKDPALSKMLLTVCELYLRRRERDA
jgi:hypothetical protein